MSLATTQPPPSSPGSDIEVSSRDLQSRLHIGSSTTHSFGHHVTPYDADEYRPTQGAMALSTPSETSRASFQTGLPQRDTPTHVRAMFDELQKVRRIRNLVQDADGSMYALCCSECGGNTSSTAQTSTPTFDLQYMRSHLTKTHSLGMDRQAADEVLERCKGPPLSGEDVRRIYNNEPSFVDDRIQVKRATAKRRRDVSSQEEEGELHIPLCRVTSMLTRISIRLSGRALKSREAVRWSSLWATQRDRRPQQVATARAYHDTYLSVCEVLRPQFRHRRFGTVDERCGQEPSGHG